MATNGKKKTGTRTVKAAKAVENKVKNKKTIAGIVSAIAAPIALLAIGYGLTKLDARTGGKVMGMIMNR